MNKKYKKLSAGAKRRKNSDRVAIVVAVLATIFAILVGLYAAFQEDLAEYLLSQQDVRVIRTVGAYADSADSDATIYIVALRPFSPEREEEAWRAGEEKVRQSYAGLENPIARPLTRAGRETVKSDLYGTEIWLRFAMK